MRETMAGLVAGLAMGVIFIGAAAAMLPTLDLARLARRLPEGTSLGLLGMIVALFIPLVWAFLGAMAGLIYLTATHLVPGPGLGSPNLAFTLAVLALSIAGSLLLLLTQKRVVGQGLVISLSFAASFGWLLPNLAR